MMLIPLLKWIIAVVVLFVILGAALAIKLNINSKKAMRSGVEVFVSPHNQYGKISIIKTVEKRAKGGTVLVIPFIPIPFIGEYNTVEIERLFYTTVDGKKLDLGEYYSRLELLDLTEIEEAYYYTRQPFSNNNDRFLNILLNSEHRPYLFSIAKCLQLNKAAFEAKIQRELNAVAVKKRATYGVAVDKEPFFFLDMPLDNQDIEIGFEYTGAHFSELRVVKRQKNKGFVDGVGDVYIQKGLNLFDAIGTLTPSTFRELKYPNPPEVQGVMFRLYKKDLIASDQKKAITPKEVIEALKQLPRMKSIGSDITFDAYYKQKQNLINNPKHYLLSLSAE